MDKIEYKSSSKCLLAAVIRTFLMGAVWICLFIGIIFNAVRGEGYFNEIEWSIFAAVMLSFLYTYLWCGNTVEINESNILTVSNVLGFKKSFDLSECKFDRFVADFQIRHLHIVYAYFLVLKTGGRDKRIPCRYLSDEDFEDLIAELVKRGAWANAVTAEKAFGIDNGITVGIFYLKRKEIVEYFKKRNYKIGFLVILGFIAIGALCAVRDAIIGRFDPRGYIGLFGLILFSGAAVFAVQRSADRLQEKQYPFKISVDPEHIEIDGRIFRNESITEAAIIIGRSGGSTRLIIRTWTKNHIYWLGLPPEHKHGSHAFMELPELYATLSATLGSRATYTDKRRYKEKKRMKATDSTLAQSSDYMEFKIPRKSIFGGVHRRGRTIAFILYTVWTALILFLVVSDIADRYRLLGGEYVIRDLPIDILAFSAVMIFSCLPALIIFGILKRRIPKIVIFGADRVQINRDLYTKDDIQSAKFIENEKRNKLYLEIKEKGRTKKYLMGNARQIKPSDFIYEETENIDAHLQKLLSH